MNSSARIWLGLTLVSVGCARGGQFGKPNVQDQIKIGQRVAEDLRRTEKVLPLNDPHVIILRRVATHVLSSIHDQEPWAFSFDVIDSPEVNAFSLPGGPTFFYTGLMDKLKSEDELAGILAHELTQFASSQKRDLLINLGLLLSKANYALSEVAGLTNDIAFNLPFSRSEESQADQGGVKLVIQAGYNPNGMVSVFEMLSKTFGTAQELSFLSDHPSDKDRIRKLEGLIKDSNASFPPETPVTY